jgi:hypothetical protein
MIEKPEKNTNHINRKPRIVEKHDESKLPDQRETKFFGKQNPCTIMSTCNRHNLSSP